MERVEITLKMRATRTSLDRLSTWAYRECPRAQGVKRR